MTNIPRKEIGQWTTEGKGNGPLVLRVVTDLKDFAFSGEVVIYHRFPEVDARFEKMKERIVLEISGLVTKSAAF